MDFDIRRAGHLVEIETGRREAVERIQGAALQQLGEGTFEGDFKARMRAEAGENALIMRIEHGHAEHRVIAAERGVLDQDAETGGAQPGNAGGDARIAGDDFFRYIRQAERPSAITLNLTWRSRISDSAWARASLGVLPADMPLLT